MPKGIKWFRNQTGEAIHAEAGAPAPMKIIHAHIDHIGRVPDPINAGFSGDIIYTLGTKAPKAAGDHPIRFKHLYAVEKFQDHQRLLHLNGPAVINVGSGW
jgi:hypothetical protein